MNNKMDTSIYYNPKEKWVLFTNDFEERQKRMDLGSLPKIDYKKIDAIPELKDYAFAGITFNNINDDYFQQIKEIFSELKLESLAFHESTVDLSDVVIDVQDLLIGDKSKVNIAEKNFKNLEEITFLEVKSYKGKVLTKFNSVKKIVMWYEAKKANTVLPNFPELKELHIFNGSEVQLDLRGNKNIESLKLANFPKLEKVLLSDDNVIKEFTLENCKILDISELPVTSIWPPRKDKKETNSANIMIKSTGNKHIDNLILDLKKNMEDYMNENDPSYSRNDIDESISLLSEHVIAVSNTGLKDEAMEIVKSTVLKLNELNEKCDYSLIETNEREQIAEIIILAGNEKGYNSADEDITEEWREW